MKKAILLLTMAEFASKLEGARGFIAGQTNWSWKYDYHLRSWVLYDVNHTQYNLVFPYFDSDTLAADAFAELEERFPLNDLLDFYPQNTDIYTNYTEELRGEH